MKRKLNVALQRRANSFNTLSPTAQVTAQPRPLQAIVRLRDSSDLT